jgi:hypothetical protein
LTVTGAVTNSNTTTLTGATTASTITAGGIQATAIGNVTPGTGAFTTVTTTGVATLASANVTGTLGVTGATTLAGLTAGATTLGATTATSINNTPIGATTASTGAFTTLTSSGAATLNSAAVTGNATVGGTLGVTGATTLAGVTTGAATLLSANVTNNATVGGTLGVTGATTLTTATAGGLQATAIGNVTPGTGAFTNLTASGTLAVTGTATAGNVSTTGTVSTATVSATGNITAANVIATGGFYGRLYGTLEGDASIANIARYVITTTTSTNGTYYPAFVNATTGNLAPITNSSLTYNPGTGALAATSLTATNVASTYVTPTNLATANAVITGGTINNTTIGATTAAAGTFTNVNATNVTGTNVTGTYVTATNFSTANAQITGGSFTIASADVTYLTATNFSSGNAAITGGSVNGTPIGAITTSTGAFSTLTTSGTATLANANVTGALNVTGTSNFTANATFGNAVTINSSKTANSDFTVAGVNTDTLIWAHAASAYDSVIIGNTATAGNLVTGAKLIINSTDSIIIPIGSNAQRPSNSGGTDVAGMVRFNNFSNQVEFYTGSMWQGTGTTFTLISDQQFSGDGATTAYTLSQATTTAASIVSINGVIQFPTLAYSVSGTTLTFTEAPETGDVIDIRVLTTTQTVTGIASSNGYMSVAADNNGLYITTGTNAPAVTTTFNTAGAQVSSIANVAVGTSATTIDTMSTSTYRSAKYVIQITNGSDYQAMEALLISNGTTATVTTYGTVSTGASLGTVSATQSGSNALLQFTGTTAGNQVRIKKDYIVI